MNLEIRWFIEGKLPESDIKNWMDKWKLEEEKTEDGKDRIDNYLVLPKPHCDFIGVKTREGKFEIKYKIASYTFESKDQKIHGKAEFWSKYSKKLEKGRIEHFNELGMDQLEVKKKRFNAGWKFEYPYKKPQHTEDHINQGFKFEVTDLEIVGNDQIKNKYWWTIGIDFYGVDHEKMFKKGFSLIFEEFPLDIKEILRKSHSYPEWASIIYV